MPTISADAPMIPAQMNALTESYSVRKCYAGSRRMTPAPVDKVNNMDEQIEELLNDRGKFNDFIYTPLEKAVEEISRRSSNMEFIRNLKESLPIDIPKPMKNKKTAVMFRQIATPNYEFRRFVSIIDSLEGFDPLVFEYFKDKFTDNNEYKYYLGMMPFFCGRGKKGGEKICLLNIIDFNSSRGKKISEIKTIWGETLIEFHHTLINHLYRDKMVNLTLFDASEWFSRNGGKAANYYQNFLALFLKDAILFENFMLDVKELSFTRDIFLPAFISVFNKYREKPLIVALAPTEVESDTFWMCHPEEVMTMVDEKINI